MIVVAWALVVAGAASTLLGVRSGDPAWLLAGIAAATIGLLALSLDVVTSRRRTSGASDGGSQASGAPEGDAGR